MVQPNVLCYSDVVQAAMDFLGGLATSASQGGIRRCIHAAYNELAAAHEWTFLRKEGRVHLKAAYTTETITYTHSGYLITGASTEFPSWAANAVIKIGDAYHQVTTRSSNTSLTLDATLNPGADVDSGTSYSLYPQWYALPHDFHSFDGVYTETNWWLGERVSDGKMLALHRYSDSTGPTRFYCIREVPELHGTKGVFIYPPSDETTTLDFVYKRIPRQLRYSGHESNEYAGSIIITGGETTVEGSSTAFKAGMVGSMLRIGDDNTNVPTGLDGTEPFAQQQVIATRTSDTSITLASTMSTASTVKCRVTDIIDLGYAVHEAFHACVRKNLAIQRNMKEKETFIRDYREALFQAKAADCPDTSVQVAGPRRPKLFRLRDSLSIGSDI